MKKYCFNLPDLPEFLAAEMEDHWKHFLHAASQAGINMNAVTDIHEEACRIWPFSDFVARCCIAAPEMLSDLVETGDLHISGPAAGFRSRLSSLIDNVQDDQALGTALRAFRRREMVRIAWRDLAGMADLAETMNDLSLLAEACLHHSCRLLYNRLCLEFGEPLNIDGRPQELVVIAMGKLGAGELNFSSDIDLIFAFPEHGETIGGSLGKKISCTRFFTRMCRRLIAVIGAPRSDGLVFRVDTRLRPWGDSGPIVMNFDAIENYYETQGRDWERYAWIKARPVAGDIEAGHELLNRLSPFVYRRYLDYNAFDALREMKSMIETEAGRKGMSDNVKLGPGGIREVEFIVQAFQLLQGGRDMELRNPVLLQILPLLVHRGVIPESACAELEDAYIFLRNAEHRLQEYNDSQTQNLPEDQKMQERLALSMGFPAREPFRGQMETFMETVHGHFHALFMHDRIDNDENGASRIWQAVKAGNPERGSMHLLETMGFNDPESAAALLSGLEDTREVRSMLPQGRRRLDSLMPRIIRSASATPDPLQALRIISSILQVIARRTVYISLLDENPEAVDHLVKLCMASPWITSFITRRPVVLDELLDPRTLYSPPDRDELKQMLQLRFHSIPNNDLETQMDELRMFRQSAVMRIAAADITGAVPLMKVSDYLTETAGVIIEKTLELSSMQMAAKCMDVSPSADECRGKSGFLVIAYGKFGGFELGYGSDLDLVFVHDGTGEPNTAFAHASPVFYARTGQRMIHFLTARTPAGMLYQADMRLRPGGESGPLVCSIERLGHYLKNEAWTWEHQAMIRARPVAGSPAPARKFQEIRKQIITMERDEEKLRHEVRSMRDRMIRSSTDNAASHGMFDIKRHRGGIIDIEFMVQYLVLLHACRYPGLCEWTDNIRLIETLEADSIISGAQARTLREIYISFRKTVHRLSLQEKPAIVPFDKFSHEAKEVSSLWTTIIS